MRTLLVTLGGSAGSKELGSQGTDDGLKIDFTATKTLGSKQNTASVTIYNLALSTRNKLGKEFDKVTIQAGYRDGTRAVIFDGNIRDFENDIEGPEIKTTIECGDGDEGVNKGSVSETFKKGTKPKEIVEKLVKGLPGVQKGQIRGLDDLPETKRPLSVWGWTHRELDELGRTFGFYWSIQNGRFQALKNDEALPRTIIVSKETGMIGVPKVTDKGVSAVVLMEPDLLPGVTVDVRSEFLDEGSGRDKRQSDAGGGLFRVSTCTYSGSNRDNEFQVAFEAHRLQGKKVK